MDIRIRCVFHTLKKHEMLEIFEINSIYICLLTCHRHTMCEYFMESLNFPSCFCILNSLFFSQICWLQLATYFFYFFGPICCQSHAVKKVKKKAYNCSFRHTCCLWCSLWICQKKLLRVMYRMRKSTQLQISSDSFEVLLTASLEVSSCLGWIYWLALTSSHDGALNWLISLKATISKAFILSVNIPH